MPETDFHQSLTLENFTVFNNATLEFLPGINVLVGENGTGKTHVLKCLYAWHLARHLAEKGRPSNYETIFQEVFRVDTVGELQRTKRRASTVSGTYGAVSWKVGLQASVAADDGSRPMLSRPVFIPSIEMMALARNMDGLLRDYADFDRTCFDYVSMLTAKETQRANGASASVSTEFGNLLPGEVQWDIEAKRFYLETSGNRVPFQILAEGERKIAGLLRLIELGFIRSGTTLFWDEPEVNINPKWMDELVKQLIEIASKGIQIIIATHSYVILKEIQLGILKRQLSGKELPSARFFSLSKVRGVSQVGWSDDFASLQPNPILDQYDQMLIEDMKLADKQSSSKREQQ